MTVICYIVPHKMANHIHKTSTLLLMNLLLFMIPFDCSKIYHYTAYYHIVNRAPRLPPTARSSTSWSRAPRERWKLCPTEMFVNGLGVTWHMVSSWYTCLVLLSCSRKPNSSHGISDVAKYVHWAFEYCGQFTRNKITSMSTNPFNLPMNGL